MAEAERQTIISHPGARLRWRDRDDVRVRYSRTPSSLSSYNSVNREGRLATKGCKKINILIFTARLKTVIARHMFVYKCASVRGSGDKANLRSEEAGGGKRVLYVSFHVSNNCWSGGPTCGLYGR